VTDASTAQTPERGALRPLLPIGIGLIMVIIDPTLTAWDPLPDWFGWLLILAGTWVLARKLPSGRLLLVTGFLALLAAAAIWPPELLDRMQDAEPSLLWAASLPSLAWLTLYCLALSGLSHREPAVSFWWKYLAIAHAAAAVLPVFIFGAGIGGLTTLFVVLQALGLWGTTVFTLVYSGRAWAVVGRTKA